MRTKRVLVAVVFGLGCGVLTVLALLPRQPSVQAADFTYQWAAARVLLHGGNPYVELRHIPLPYGSVFLYPLPAAVLTVPFAPLSATLAAGAFMAVSCGLLAFALSGEAWWPLLMFVSVPMFRAIRSVQWSPLLVAAALLWPLLGLVVAKPQLSLGLLAYQRTRRAIIAALIGGAVLCVVALVIDLRWPVEWLSQLRDGAYNTQYMTPLLRWYGWPITLALLRWREPEGRLVFFLGCVPQNAFFYDQLPLLLVARTRIELLGMVLVSWLAYLPIYLHPSLLPPVPMSHHDFPYMVVGMYWPALVLVLTRRHE